MKRPDFASILTAAINRQPHAPHASVWQKEGVGARVYLPNRQFLCVSQGGDVSTTQRGRVTYLPSALFRTQALAVAAGIEAYRADQRAALDAEAAARDAMYTPRTTRTNPSPRRSPRLAAHVDSYERKYADLPAPRTHFDCNVRANKTDVRTHFNLNTGGYTIDQHVSVGWRKRETVQDILLKAAYFQFKPSGHRDYLESMQVLCFDKKTGQTRKAGRRNVHAWVFGIESRPPATLGDDWRPARYSVDSPCFVDMETRRCLPNDRSVDVFLGSRPNAGPDGKPVKSQYCRGRTTPVLPVMFWRSRSLD